MKNDIKQTFDILRKPFFKADCPTCVHQKESYATGTYCGNCLEEFSNGNLVASAKFYEWDGTFDECD